MILAADIATGPAAAETDFARAEQMIAKGIEREFGLKLKSRGMSDLDVPHRSVADLDNLTFLRIDSIVITGLLATDRRGSGRR